MKKFFTEAELGQIKSAVAEAEKATSAEIVPVFFESCGNYHDTYWKSGIIFATLWSFLFAIYQSSAVGIWNISLQFFFLTQMTAGILGVIAAYFFPPWKRLLMDRVDVKRRIRMLPLKFSCKKESIKQKNELECYSL